jgi:hypothetical protein
VNPPAGFPARSQIVLLYRLLRLCVGSVRPKYFCVNGFAKSAGHTRPRPPMLPETAGVVLKEIVGTDPFTAK